MWFLTHIVSVNMISWHHGHVVWRDDQVRICWGSYFLKKHWTWQKIRTWPQIVTSRKRFVLNVIVVSDYKCNFNALIDSNFQNLWTPFSIVGTKISCLYIWVGVIIHNLQKVSPVSRFHVQTECRRAGILQAVWLCSQLHHGHHHTSQEEAGWYLLSSVDLL